MGAIVLGSPCANAIPRLEPIVQRMRCRLCKQLPEDQNPLLYLHEGLWMLVSELVQPNLSL